jgi:tRNA (mo5U34)-methyltransferase
MKLGPVELVVSLPRRAATPGADSLTAATDDQRDQVSLYRLPPSLTGMRCLDVSNGDGFWASELERRGAAEIISVRSGSVEVYELAPERSGRFDLVLVNDLLLNVRDPELALERLRSVCKQTLILADAYNPALDEFGDLCLSEFRGGSGGNSHAWWSPSVNTLKKMTLVAGFEPVEELARLSEPTHRVVLRAGIPAVHSWQAMLRASAPSDSTVAASTPRSAPEVL